ncbi:hypothetical protein ACFPAF_18590 [Hymenobacter endophyticus]|uniref:Uncharacterized protein n=1 Tax=Hymenobacter endophyticus TaxID=3076335 RepID=A0ABU3TM25_9BACT|nr:hypothetical protein [Hymenobacter endophyticus]MDU0372416.1 hypothetical protein [Hymenobacter endophyticus]
MSVHDDLYPAWLTEHLANYSFNWENSVSTSFPELLDSITLHDSYWHHTISPGDNSIVLVIELDAIWNKSFCYQQTNWPYLIIRINRVINSFNDFTQDDFRGTIGDTESLQVNISRFNEWLEFAKVYDLLPVDLYEHFPIRKSMHRTEISTVYGGVLSITHEASIQTLLYTADGQSLKINIKNRSVE